MLSIFHMTMRFQRQDVPDVIQETVFTLPLRDVTRNPVRPVQPEP